jgi:hypothetical protein
MTTEPLNMDTGLPADHPMLIQTAPETNPNHHIYVSVPETIKVQVDAGFAMVIMIFIAMGLWVAKK